MYPPTAQRQSPPAPRLPWLLLALFASGALAMAGGLSHRHGLTFAAVALLLLAWLPSVWRRHSLAALAMWAALAALLLVPALLGHPQLAWMALPVVFLAVFAWLFARTLRRGEEPLVSRFVRVIEGGERLQLPGVAAYTRSVTLFWACLLGGMALLSLAIALFARPGGWLTAFGMRVPFALPGGLLAWFPEAGCWIMLLAAFACEYAFRRWHLRHITHPSVRRFAVQIVRRWPALLRGEDRAA